MNSSGMVGQKIYLEEMKLGQYSASLHWPWSFSRRTSQKKFPWQIRAREEKSQQGKGSHCGRLL